MPWVSKITYSFLINRSPRGRRKKSRGICQGDPLSLNIFILCSDQVLSKLCNKAQEYGSFKWIRVARGSPQVNHLLLADCNIFYIKANKDNIKAFNDLLQRYEEACRQAIIYAKSTVKKIHHIQR